MIFRCSLANAADRRKSGGAMLLELGATSLELILWFQLLFSSSGLTERRRYSCERYLAIPVHSILS